MLETFTVETFAPLLGSTFTARAFGADGSPHDVPLTLDRATPATAPAGDRGRPPFSLEFAGPAELRLPQGTFKLQHATLGAFDLFIVPVAADTQQVRYEAVFT